MKIPRTSSEQNSHKNTQFLMYKVFLETSLKNLCLSYVKKNLNSNLKTGQTIPIVELNLRSSLFGRLIN
jgi:hypothetical protein